MTEQCSHCGHDKDDHWIYVDPTSAPWCSECECAEYMPDTGDGLGMTTHDIDDEETA